MKPIASFVSVVATVGLLGACAGQPPVTHSNYHDNYHPRNFLKYHAARDTRLEIVGDRLGMETDVFANAVSRAMYGQHYGRPSNFTTRPGPSAEKNLYVIMAFNVAHDRHLCSAATGKLDPRKVAGMTEVQGAWCWGNETQAWILTQGPAARPGDSGFDSLVAATTQELFTANPDVELYEDEGGGGNDSLP